MVRTRESSQTDVRRRRALALPLAQRAEVDELLDAGPHPEDDLYGTFTDMRRVNRWLGGVDITLRGVRRLIGHLRPGDGLSVLDIGTGHADIPRAVADWAGSRGLDCEIVGVDLDLPTLRTGARLPQNRNVRFLQGDILRVPIRDYAVDIAMCSMTLHHLDDEQAVEALREMARVARLGIIVNDLTRSLHGYVVAWLLGRLATRNRLTRHDAHRSIQRARTTEELSDLARHAGLQAPVFDSVLGYRTAMTVGVRPW